MKYLLIIKGDPNDADYITEETEYTEAQFKKIEPFLKKVGSAIAQKDGEWNSMEVGHQDSLEEVYGELLTADEIERFNELTPSGEEGGIHSIESIKVYVVQETINFLKK